MQPRPATPRQPLGFAEAFAHAGPVAGWLTDEQAARLHAAASAVPAGGTVVEIGSHRGRSTIMLAAGLPTDARLVAVDPFLPDWRYGAADVEEELRANLAAAGVADRVDVRVGTSRAVLAGWRAPVDLVYVDGKHDYRSCRADLRWAAHLPAGGTVLVHDGFSSLGVTLALLRTLLLRPRLRYAGRVGSLVELRVARPRRGDRRRVLAQLPWWIRNLLVKVLLRIRATRLAGALGHHDSADPY